MEAYGKRVLARFQSEGLKDIGEDALKKISDILFEEAKVEVLGNDKAWDNILVPALDIAQSGLNKMIDKIDGKEG